MTTVNQAKAAQLRADAATILREAERLDRQDAADKALARELRRPVMPTKRDASEAAYLVFQRELSGRQYSYAAVLFGIGDSAKVVHTGRNDSGRRRAYTWDDFLTFVGENNWHTLQLMTLAEPLRSKSGATVNDLGAMADAVVNDGCPEQVEPYHGKAGPSTPFGERYTGGW